MRAFVLIALLVSGCVTDAVHAQAYRIARQEDLIGGPSALGQVGDYMLQNGHIRVIIQDAGFSRGFGVYGGSIIDADIRRSIDGDGQGGKGNDRFAELFPVYFLQAAKTTNIEVKNDGSNGKAARILVRADAGPFLSQLNPLNDLALGPKNFAYEIEYSLGKGDRAVKMTSSLTNVSGSARALRIAAGALSIRVPFGAVALFGSQNQVFVPGPAGFDLRWTLPDYIKANPVSLPALPGITADMIATKGFGVSYGVFTEPLGENNFAYANRNIYGPNTNEGSLEIPFFFSSFIGYFYAVGPALIDNLDTFSFTQYFAVGKGDVAAIRDIYNQTRKIETGKFGGRVRDSQTLRGAGDVSVVVYDGAGHPFNQHSTNVDGDFVGTYPPGEYSYELVTDRTNIPPRVPFTVTAGKTTSIDTVLQTGAFINVEVVDTLGRPLPSKVTVVGRHDYSADPEPRHFLFNLARGERRRSVDQVPDLEADPATREFIELQQWSADGNIGAELRPGRYTVYVSRGPEYELYAETRDFVAHELQRFAVTLKRVVHTPGYIAGDMHLHSANSIDSGLSVRDRVVGCVAEGLEFAVATDHNYITDYSPQVADLNLQQFLVPIVGLELTTLELGHFNGYPLKYDLSESTHGSFSWFGRKAQEIFDDLHARAKYGPEETIIQVNHPRDGLLGYFSQINLDAETSEGKSPYSSSSFSSQGEPFLPQNWSFDFDVLEIMNGKRWDLLRTVRVPDILPPPPYVVPDARPGDILRYPSGQIAYPGVVDDWFHFLNQNKRFTGVANSDSHANSVEEPGTPRTYVYVGKDDPFLVRDNEIARAIKAHRAILTSGPFVELFVNDQPVGSEVAGTKEIDVRVRVQKAAWVHVDTLSLYINGQLARQHALNDVYDDLVTDHFSLAADAWIVAEVSSRQGVSLWPAVAGWEEPPLTVGDAVSGLAGSLGINFATLGNLQPPTPRATVPYALTNPIWIDVEGDGHFSAPGNPQKAMRSPSREEKANFGPAPKPDDIRAVFKMLGGGHH